MCANENKVKAKRLYDLKLHQSMEVGDGRVQYVVVRVIGGWIYNHVRLDLGHMNSTFVPFDNEFQQK